MLYLDIDFLLDSAMNINSDKIWDVNKTVISNIEAQWRILWVTGPQYLKLMRHRTG